MGGGASANSGPPPPPRLRGMLATPVTVKHTRAGSGKGLVFGLSAMQGYRPSMEDAHATVGEIPGLEDHAFFAVFDGHGGARVARFLAGSMLRRIQVCVVRSPPREDAFASGILF